MTVPAPVPLSRRERRKQTTRTALVSAALRLFDERGYAHVTVDDICAAADVSPRTFFRYFRQKDDVLMAPVTEHLEEVLAALRERPAGEPSWAALRAALGVLAEHVDDRRDEELRIWRILQEAPDSVAVNARSFVDWEAAMVDQVAGRLGRPTADLAAHVLTGMALVALRAGFEQWARHGGHQPLTRHLAAAFDLVERGPGG